MAPIEKPCRGRPRTFDAEAGVDLALRAFARRGYDDVSVSDLCDALAIKPPSLYAAYGSKRALFDRAVARYGAASGQVYEEAISGASDLADLRRRVLLAALDLYLRDGGVGCLVLGTLGSTGDSALRDDLGAIVAARRAAMMARAMELGADADTARAEVSAISVAMMGLSAAARSGMDDQTLRTAALRLI
ncbi:TetR/AcrR family transcriptional regulator [Jannaschia pohangensis]|uniref:Transcriptional regulator, TetR family n=1 Tax=Jannaschia pohangensis TaxID=390807 RepID=A0A1I3MJR1_9RHOB|nr:TetR/AcrR family transcriptional regulator [Jannaschia pohangensis]SFI97000.1 transcriptional regulator, TetR family [Jannaschia pohangensis]